MSTNPETLSSGAHHYRWRHTKSESAIDVWYGGQKGWEICIDHTVVATFKHGKLFEEFMVKVLHFDIAIEKNTSLTCKCGEWIGVYR